MINTTPLNSIHADDIPSDLQEALLDLENHLKKQQSNVKTVTILPNCSIDYDRTIHVQKTLSEDIKWVLQGVLVTVKPEYKLSYEDAMWFHPEMAKGRSIYSIDQDISREKLNSVKEMHHIDGDYDKEDPTNISPFHCDVGEYDAITIDDMGLETIQKHLVVNCSFEALTYPLWTQYLMTGETIGKVYDNWTKMDMGNGKSIMDTSAHVRDAIAQKVLNTTMHDVSQRKIYSDEVNALYSDGHSVYIANHAVKTPKEDGGKILIHLSALSGYELYNSIKTDELFVPSNLGLSSKTFNWDDMSVAQRKRIFNDCIWEGNEGFNTYVLKPPGLVAQNKKAFENQYNLNQSSKLRMKVAKFSSQPVRDFIDIGKLLKLTPLAAHMDGITTQAYHGKDIRVPLSLNYQPFKDLINKFEELSKEHPNFQLFNSELIDGGYIKIPREIINKL
tara:strand:- start:538 stop:1875 length:1338 start_codon:yes stop_codon:yes gene_type:complete